MSKSTNQLALDVAFNSCYTIISSMDLLANQIKYDPMYQFPQGHYQWQAHFWIYSLENAVEMFKTIGNCSHLLEQAKSLMKDIARITFDDYKLILEVTLKVDDLLKSIRKFKENLPIIEQAYLQ
jgi:hypothetical protein